MALSRIGAQAIESLTDQSNTSAIECAMNWQLALLEVARAHDWNCLKKAVVLAAVDQTPISPDTGVPAGTTEWAQFTNYAANAYVTYGGQLYQAFITHTSTASFTNDLTAGDWFQTDVLNGSAFDECSASNYASGWSYQYALPADFVTMVSLNDQKYDRHKTSYELMGRYLYTNDSSAVIQYVATIDDTTIYDALFVGALVYMLAAKVATKLRADSGAISQQMLGDYKMALREARVKDSNEGTSRRFNPVHNSRIVSSRWSSTNS